MLRSKVWNLEGTGIGIRTEHYSILIWRERKGKSFALLILIFMYCVLFSTFYLGMFCMAVSFFDNMR